MHVSMYPFFQQIFLKNSLLVYAESDMEINHKSPALKEFTFHLGKQVNIFLQHSLIMQAEDNMRAQGKIIQQYG